MGTGFFSVFIVTGIILLLLQGCSSGGSGSATCALGSGGDVVISGQVTYDRIHHNADGGLDYNNITREPVRGARVEAVCNSVVTSASTDAAGNYSLSLPANTRNAFIRVKAQMLKTGTPSWNYTVVDNSQNQAVYSMTGSNFDSGTADSTRNLHAVSGWTGSSYSETRVAAPFAILDSVYDAHQTVLNQEPNAAFPALKLNWHSENTDGTYYDGNDIYVLGKVNNDTDEYDYHVIIHEWGHYFQHHFSRDDSVGGFHGGGDILDIRVAFSEGFGNAFSAIASGNSNYADSLGFGQNGTNSFTFDLEDNGCVNDGWYSECSVQSIFYDLYDDAVDGVDNINLGFTPLYSVLRYDMPNFSAFTSLFSLIKPLKDNTGQGALIDPLLTFQSISAFSDEYGTGTNDAGYTGSTAVTPVYTDASALPSSVCSTGENQGYNGLGVYRFIKIVGTGSRVTFEAVRNSGVSPSDPDLELFLKGRRLATAWSVTADSETLAYDLVAGETYILQVNEDTYFNISYTPDGDDTTCFDITQS